MNSVSIFLELDSDGMPLYEDIFKKRVMNNEIVYASEEYIQVLDNEKRKNVHGIPHHILDEIDKQLDSKVNRSSLLKITYQENIEKWFDDEIKSLQGCDEFLLFGDYESFLNVARKEHFPCLVYENSSITQKANVNEKYYQKVIQDMRNHINFVEEQLRESRGIVESLRKDIESNGNYIHNLEKHATELDNEKEKYKAFYEENVEKVEAIDRQAELCEERISKYLDMYKEVMKELDEKKVEVLELKKQLERKK